MIKSLLGRLVSSKASRLGLQRAIFLLWPHVVFFFLHLCILGVSLCVRFLL